MKTSDQLPPNIFVIFGGAGDLTWRKLMPALFDLSQSHNIPAQFSILAVDRVELSEDALRKRLHEGKNTVRSIVFAILMASFGCTTHAVLQVNSEYPKHRPPADLRTEFPPAGQTRMELVADHLLGKEYLPGGNIADYNTNVGVFQMFLIKEKDTTKAANLILDWRASHADLQYMPKIGGYYGLDNGTPVYLFSKGLFVAGLVGLDANDADLQARGFAARL
jgi:hypothetical protein